MGNKHKKQIIPKSAIIAGIVLFSLVMPQLAFADAVTDAINKIATNLLYRLTHLIFSFLGFLVTAGGHSLKEC